MSEQQPQSSQHDEVGVNDTIVVGQPNPHIERGDGGEIVFAGGVKGPDPDVWGDPADRPDPFASTGPAELPEGAKGPDPDVWG